MATGWRPSTNCVTPLLKLMANTRPAQVNQKQAADMLGVSTRTVYNMLKAGILRLNKCGMISIEQIDAVLENV